MQKNNLSIFAANSKQQTLIYFIVTNGGTLTHTDDDFRRANFFFCDGMDDPWLNEYVSLRNLVSCSQVVDAILDYYLDV